jgi:hypothetical protein
MPLSAVLAINYRDGIARRSPGFIIAVTFQTVCMPLIERHIYVEGQDGKQILRTYYHNEREETPYGKARAERKEAKREERSKLQIARHQRYWRATSFREKGYTWSMGYNQCSGRYSPGNRYSRFGGSSLNRSPQLNLYAGEKDIPTDTTDSFRMAIKAAAAFSRRKLDVPEEISNYLMQRDIESERKFRLWLSVPHDWPKVGFSLPIHELSARSRGKIKDKATAFFRASPGNRVFCTLTFVAPVDDRTGVTILNKFLTSARKSFKGLQYFWVAERQDNGNIHFHIILNKRLPVRRWNALWVMAQYNSGLIGCDKFGEKVSKAEILMRFENDTVHKVFNPLDIKKVKSISGLSGYLTKYITKQKKTPFTCLPWHCSRRVSRMFTRTTVGHSAFAYMKSFNNYRVDKDTGECFEPMVSKPHPFYMVVYAANKSAPLKYLREMEQVNKWILEGFEFDRLSLIDDDLYRKKFCKN